MKKFLRYHGKHNLWFPRGYRGWVMPRLNPLESCSHGANKKRTWHIWEPTWIYLLRQRLFCFAGKQRCGRRGNDGTQGSLPDHWNIGGDGNRTCSFCGSINFYDLVKIAHRTIDDPRYGVEGTTKSYKVYVRQPNVVNAGQGAIKFYTPHIPEDRLDEDMKIVNDAMQATHKRFDEAWAARKL